MHSKPDQPPTTRVWTQRGAHPKLSLVLVREWKHSFHSRTVSTHAVALWLSMSVLSGSICPTGIPYTLYDIRIRKSKISALALSVANQTPHKTQGAPKKERKKKAMYLGFLVIF
jgi:hypothetical protein